MYIYVCRYINKYLCVCVCIHIYACVYVSISIFIFIYTPSGLALDHTLHLQPPGLTLNPICNEVKRLLKGTG